MTAVISDGTSYYLHIYSNISWQVCRCLFGVYGQKCIFWLNIEVGDEDLFTRYFDLNNHMHTLTLFNLKVQEKGSSGDLVSITVNLSSLIAFMKPKHAASLKTWTVLEMKKENSITWFVRDRKSSKIKAFPTTTSSSSSSPRGSCKPPVRFITRYRIKVKIAATGRRRWQTNARS